MADERERCPKCGADAVKNHEGSTWFECQSELYHDDGFLFETERCLRRQLAQAQERLAEAERVNSALDVALVSAQRQLEQALAREADLRRVLKKIEWRVHDPNENGDVCPWCGWEKRDGHTPDCELAAALSSAPGGGSGE